MKNGLKASISIMAGFLITITMFGISIPAYGASSSTQPVDPSQIVPTISPVLNANAPWIGNITFSTKLYDVSSAQPLKIQIEYKNLPLESGFPTTKIYKLTDSSKTNLSKNYINYDALTDQSLPTLDSSKLAQNGTESFNWFGEKSLYEFADPGEYVFEAQWKYGIQNLTATSQFTVKNDTKLVPLHLNNLTFNPNPFNPQTAKLLNFKFTIAGLLKDETADITLLIKNASKKEFSYTKSGLTEGNNSVTWNGKDSLNSQPVLDGAHQFTLNLHTSLGRNFQPVSGLFTTNSTVGNSVPVSVSSILAPGASLKNCAGFKDILTTDPNCQVYSWVKTTGIFTGNNDGTFKPDELLQRDQVAKVVLEAFGKYKAGTEYCQSGDPFSDVPSASWAREYVCLGKKTLVKGDFLLTGYLSGPNTGLFLPTNPVNRSEFLAMVLRNVTVNVPNGDTISYTDVPLNQWDSGFAAYSAQYLTAIYPQPKFNRSQNVTRLEAAKVLYALHNQGSL